MSNNWRDNLPEAHGGCTCECHRFPLSHVAACCWPSMDDRNIDSATEQTPALEGEK